MCNYMLLYDIILDYILYNDKISYDIILRTLYHLVSYVCTLNCIILYDVIGYCINQCPGQHDMM